MIIECGKEIFHENVLIKMAPSQTDPGNLRRKLAACGDCCWDKWASGRWFDSISGCSVVIGCEAKLAMGIAPMSNDCNKCERGIHHSKNGCPKNVTCS